MGYFLPEYARNRPRSRIVCTLGPASSSAETIRALIEAGMSVARINTSHDTAESHRAVIQTVRGVSDSVGVPIGILVDLPGPKYRLGELPGDGTRVDAGDTVTLVAGEPVPGGAGVAVLPAGIEEHVAPGDDILIADGAIRLVARAVRDRHIECEVTTGGLMESHKAVAVPGRPSKLPYLTGATLRALDLAIENRVDFVGLSYTRSVADIAAVREHVARRNGEARLIAKIELQQALDQIDEIIAASDGVMVARGDLGVELPVARVPGAQKLIIRRANAQGKIVITATQMLESMINSATPTRAEITDIANAVLDGSDAIMLSAETSVGRFPVQTTQVMAEAAREAEKLIDSQAVLARRASEISHTVDDAIAYTACWAAADIGASVILAFTEGGSTAARVAAFRPAAPILALFRNPAAARRLSLRWGVTALPAPSLSSVQWMFHEGSLAAIATGYAAPGDLAIAVVGMPIGIPGNTNLLRVIRLPEAEPTFDRNLVDDAVHAPG